MLCVFFWAKGSSVPFTAKNDRCRNSKTCFSRNWKGKRGAQTQYRITWSKLHIFCWKKKLGRWLSYSLYVYIVFVGCEGCLCCFNFERDIVDTLCHASRRSDTTRPNKSVFQLQEGRVRRVEMLSRALNFLLGGICKGWKIYWVCLCAFLERGGWLACPAPNQWCFSVTHRICWFGMDVFWSPWWWFTSWLQVKYILFVLAKTEGCGLLA